MPKTETTPLKPSKEVLLKAFQIYRLLKSFNISHDQMLEIVELTKIKLQNMKALKGHENQLIIS